MAQLDLSIIFDQFFITIVSLYFFIHLFSFMLIKFFYNVKFRDILVSFDKQDIIEDNISIKKILVL